MNLAPRFAVLATLLAVYACGGGRCPGGTRLDKLTAQLRGECCEFCSEPTDAQPDNSCKEGQPSSMWARHPQYECPRWAAHCLSEQGPAAAPALIAAARTGPDNFDTGDGIIPVRDAILTSLGKTGSADAVPVLLEALAQKRGSPEAALEGLKWLGPVARPAVPAIVPRLATPGRVREYAADALGAIGDPSAVPALIGALNPDDRVMVRRVTEALSKMGSRASAALPVLRRLVATQPDHEAHFAIRSAIRAIAGAGAANALPKSYEMLTAEISNLIREVAKRRGLARPAVKIDGTKNEVSARLASGAQLEIRFDKPTWIARRAVTGTLRVSRDERFSSMAQLERLIDSAFGK